MAFKKYAREKRKQHHNDQPDGLEHGVFPFLTGLILENARPAKLRALTQQLHGVLQRPDRP